MSNMTKRVMTEVVFAAGCKPRPDEAVRELKQAGYEVKWLPEEDRERSLDPRDDFIDDPFMRHVARLHGEIRQGVGRIALLHQRTQCRSRVVGF